MRKTILLLLIAAFSGGASHPDTTPPVRPNKDYALFFAVNDYAPNSGFDDLTKPIENAEAVAKELRDRYGFVTEVVRNPTLDQISAKLNEYKAFFAKNQLGRYPSTGQLLIYFTGHGIAEDNNGYFVPADGNIKKLYSTAFAYEIWRPFINRIDCRHILVAIDACFSATFDPDWYNKKMDPSEFRRPGELSEGDKLLQANETDRCRIAFTSDGSEDKVPERSNFARKFLEGLRNGPRQDGILTSEGLAGFLRFSAPKPRLTTFGDDENGSFLLVQKAEISVKTPETSTKTDDLEKDFAAWKAAKSANTIAAYQGYLTNFQQGEFREQAQTAITAINTDLTLRRDDLAWEVAEEKNTVEGYRKYLSEYPQGRHRTEATAKTTSSKKSDEGPISNVKLSNRETETKTSEKTDDGMVLVAGGSFIMGCTSEQQDCEEIEKPAHRVTVKDFYIGKYEVTQKLWRDIMGTGPSKFNGYDDCPVEEVSWDDVQEFLKKLNATVPIGQNPYRLPTEAEWEYAAREGGKAVLFGNGKNTADPTEINFDASASYKKSYSIAGNYRKKTVPVGSLNNPNALGLHDMSGNVYEWCSDWYGSDYYKNSTASNPSGPTSGSYRVIRGGGCFSEPKDCRVTVRNVYFRGYGIVGFRLARSK